MGTRNTPFLPKHLGQDHPHAYGDKSGLHILMVYCSGSSPRVWGQDKYFMQWASETRIIPTRMGTSIGARDEFISSEDHPHAYGDKAIFHNI